MLELFRQQWFGNSVRSDLLSLSWIHLIPQQARDHNYHKHNPGWIFMRTSRFPLIDIRTMALRWLVGHWQMLHWMSLLSDDGLANPPILSYGAPMLLPDTGH